MSAREILEVRPCVVNKVGDAKFERQDELLGKKQLHKWKQSADLIQPANNGARRPYSGFVPKIDLMDDYQDTEAVRYFGSVDDLNGERSLSPERFVHDE